MTTMTQSGPAAEPVQVAILRRVRKGRESEFESRLREFFGAAAREPGVCDVQLIRPITGSDSREYGIIRSFRSEEDMQRFYESDLYRRWQEAVRPLVEGEVRRQPIHGLEAFFRGAPPPPRWKMAVVTWLAVNPAVYLSSEGVSAAFGTLPPLVNLLLINALVVSLLTWMLMPLFTRLGRSWLQQSPR